MKSSLSITDLSWACTSAFLYLICSIMPASASSSENSCRSCAQVEELLHVVRAQGGVGWGTSARERERDKILKLHPTYLPWDRPSRQTRYMIQKIPWPLFVWLNTVTLGTGGSGGKFLPSTAHTFPMSLPHLPRCPGINWKGAIQVELNNNKDDNGSSIGTSSV